jgi:hypothetical protein
MGVCHLGWYVGGAVILLRNWTMLDMYKWSCATGKKNVCFVQRGYVRSSFKLLIIILYLPKFTYNFNLSIIYCMYKVTILSCDYQLPLCLTVYGVNPAHSASHPYEWQRSDGSWQMIVVTLNRDPVCSSVSVKVKQSHYRPRGFQEVKAPRFHDNGTGWQ